MAPRAASSPPSHSAEPVVSWGRGAHSNKLRSGEGALGTARASALGPGVQAELEKIPPPPNEDWREKEAAGPQDLGFGVDRFSASHGHLPSLARARLHCGGRLYVPHPSHTPGTTGTHLGRESKPRSFQKVPRDGTPGAEVLTSVHLQLHSFPPSLPATSGHGMEELRPQGWGVCPGWHPGRGIPGGAEVTEVGSVPRVAPREGVSEKLICSASVGQLLPHSQAGEALPEQEAVSQHFS